MAKIVDITDKLDFSGNPRLVIKGEEIEVNSDAPTVLKVMGIMSGEPGAEEVLNAYNLIFPEESRVKLDRIRLNFKSLVTVIQAAIGMITDDGDDEGNMTTRTTI